MKTWKITFKANRPYKGCILAYEIEADSKMEAVDQARRIAAVEYCGTIMTVLTATVVTPMAVLGGAA